MKKYSTVFILILVLILAAVASPALAQQGRPLRVAGEITAIDSGTGQITVKPLYRDPITVQTTVDTEFWRKIAQDGLEPITFDDLVLGDHVQVDGVWADDIVQASEVVVVPQLAAGPQTIHGLITELDLVTGTLTVQPAVGDPVPVQTSEETEFYSLLRYGRLLPVAFTDLAVGDNVKLQGAWESDVLQARRVTVIPDKPDTPPRVVTGRIETIDGSSAFELQPRQGALVTVVTNEETKFYEMVGRGHLEPITYGDLAIGQKVLNQGNWDGDAFLAQVVIVMRGQGPADAG